MSPKMTNRQAILSREEMDDKATFSKCCFQFFVRNLLHFAIDPLGLRGKRSH